MPDDVQSFGDPPLPPEVPDEGVPSTPSGPTTETGATPPAEQRSDNDGFIRINRSELGRELARLQRDEPEFANVLNSLVGQKARSKYQPRIDELEHTLASIQSQERATRFASMTKEELDAQLANDRDGSFRADYVQSTRQPDNAAMTEVLRMRRAIEASFEAAVDSGVSVDRVEHFRTQLASGAYDKASDGRDLDWGESLAAVQRDLYGELRGTVSPAATSNNGTPASTQQPAATSVISARDPNRPAVSDTAVPDLSSTQRPGQGASTFTWQEIQAMTPIEQVEHFPGERDIENAIRSGRITGVPQESLDVLRG